MVSDTLHITRAWPESYMPASPEDFIRTDTLTPAADSIGGLIILAVILLFFIFAWQRILEGVYYTLGSAFNLKKLLTIENQANTKASRDTTLLFCFLITAFVLSYYNARYHFLGNHLPVYLNFICILTALALYIVFKISVFSLLGWVNRTSVFKTIHKIGYTYAVWGFLLGMAGFTAFIIFPDIKFESLGIYTAGCVLAAFFLYFIRGYQLIIANQFSHFFWILYLCTLEILPILLTATIVFSLTEV